MFLNFSQSHNFQRKKKFHKVRQNLYVAHVITTFTKKIIVPNARLVTWSKLITVMENKRQNMCNIPDIYNTVNSAAIATKWRIIVFKYQKYLYIYLLVVTWPFSSSGQSRNYFRDFRMRKVIGPLLSWFRDGSSSIMTTATAVRLNW